MVRCSALLGLVLLVGFCSGASIGTTRGSTNKGGSPIDLLPNLDDGDTTGSIHMSITLTGLPEDAGEELASLLPSLMELSHPSMIPLPPMKSHKPLRTPTTEVSLPSLLPLPPMKFEDKPSRPPMTHPFIPPLPFFLFMEDSDEFQEPPVILPPFHDDFSQGPNFPLLEMISKLERELSNLDNDELLSLPTPPSFTVTATMPSDPSIVLTKTVYSDPELSKMVGRSGLKPSTTPPLPSTLPVKVVMSTPTQQMEKTTQEKTKRDPSEERLNEIRAAFDSVLHDAMGRPNLGRPTLGRPTLGPM